ncbi:MAG: SpoIIE family protein phosphatase [Bacillota bacterium]|nr:SpoIIE family protein phosphatase [Bacillota bacterium]
MFGRFTIYIDIVTSQSLFEPILRMVDRRVHAFLPITNVSESLELPHFKYDLIIVEYARLNADPNALQLLRNSYQNIIVIGIPRDPEIVRTLIAAGIIHYLYEDFLTIELEHLFITVTELENTKRINELYNSLFMFAQNTIVVADRKGNVQYANPFYEQISKYKTSELSHLTSDVTTSGEHDREFYIDLWDCISNGKTWEGIFINLDKDGNKFYEEATISPLYNTHGNIEKYIKIGKNITRERLLLEELAKEIKLARHILDSFMPNDFSDRFVRFRYRSEPFNEIGGDFVTFEHAEEGIYHIALIDIMGHGASAALFSIAISQMFTDYIQYMKLEDALIKINQTLLAINSEDSTLSKYVTGIFARIDIKTNTLSVVNAGHPDLVVFHRDKTVTVKPSNNMMLGVIHQSRMEVDTFPLDQIDRFVMFTDGVFDNLGVELPELVTNLREENCEMPKVDDMFDRILKQKEIKDDATLCVVEILE